MVKKINKKVNFLLILLVLSFSTSILQNYALSANNLLDFDIDTLNVAQQNTLIIGARCGPALIDPHDAYDPHSFNYIEQVCEGLFVSNYSDPSNKIIPRLALDYGNWSEDHLSYTVYLKQNIFFHDGAPFNATAVEWNFDRLAYFLNVSGTLTDDTHRSQCAPDYFWPDDVPIINRTEVIDLYIIKFILNRPYAALEGLLSFVCSYILSPKSTNPEEYISLSEGKIVGTGPFTCDNWSSNVEIKMYAFDNYWRSDLFPESNIDILIFKIYNDDLLRCQALLDGEIDFLMNPHESFLDEFDNSLNITLLESGKGSWVVYFIAMNNKLINRGIREAISYATDYNFIINNLRDGFADRLKSPIPDGLVYSNYSLNVPSLNISYAREVMQSMGYGTTFTTEEEWETANFFSLNITYYNSSKYRPYSTLLKNNLSKIGINIVDDAQNHWYSYYMKLLYKRDNLELFAIGWSAFYNDPSQFINVLYGNESIETNYFQYNGGFGDIKPYDKENDVQLLMRDALNATDPIARKKIYDKIQKLMVERDFPLIWLYTPKVYIAFKNDLEGIEQSTFCTVNQNDDSSLKADIIAIKWAHTPTDGGFAIPGYNPLLFSIVSLLFTYYFVRINRKTVKKN